MQEKIEAVARLMEEIQKGWESAADSNWVSEEEVYRILEIDR